MKEKKNDSLEVFESAPIGQAVMKNTIPAMVAMLMVLIYNLADTFFIGQTKDALMVAAVSPCYTRFSSFYGAWNGIWNRRNQCNIPCDGRRAQRICKEGMRILYVELRCSRDRNGHYHFCFYGSDSEIAWSK